MTRRTKKTISIVRLCSLALYGALLLGLGFFAKDNLIATFLPAISTQAQSTTAVPITGTIEVAFSPKGGATAAIIAALAQARNSILVSAYNFTSSELAKALLDAKKRNVNVKVILDKSQMSQRYSSAKFFINQNFDIRIDVKHAIFHNKVMIIDDKTIITGSFNFTKAAEIKNAENLIIIRDNFKLAKLYTDNWRMHWAQALRPEQFVARQKDRSTSS